MVLGSKGKTAETLKSELLNWHLHETHKQTNMGHLCGRCEVFSSVVYCNMAVLCDVFPLRRVVSKRLFEKNTWFIKSNI